MNRILSALAAAALSLIGAAASAHEFTAGSLVVHHPYLFETPPMALSAGGYMTVENGGDEADALIGIEVEGFGAGLHESVEKDGMHMMQPVARLEIPAHGSAELAPGGYHVMITGLDGKSFEAGAKVPAVLIFEKAGRVPVSFAVQKRGEGEAMPGMDHGAMDHGAMGHDMPKAGN